mgnify:CR=1 FL=1
MVAMNFQTLDTGMQMNLGLFELNNKCGYLLKPEVMRKKDSQFNPFTIDSVENVVMNTLSIQVSKRLMSFNDNSPLQILSGHFISTLSTANAGSETL